MNLLRRRPQKPLPVPGERAPTHFTVFVPAYNCVDWVKKNLRSVIKQRYENFEIVYVDDASSDDTGSVARRMLEKSGVPHTFVRNQVNRRALANLYDAVSAARDGTVIVAVDGDDWLAERTVLQRLDGIYATTDTWITAGSYKANVRGVFGKPEVDDEFWTGGFRDKKWTTSHLRSFRKELFMNIRRDDLLDRDGGFYKFTWDRAVMYPMLEMAGPAHFTPILEFLYVYNRRNPISVDRAHTEEQLRIEADLRAKSPYPRLSRL